MQSHAPRSGGTNERVGPVGLTRSFIRFWGWGVGGLLLVVIVLITAYSAAANFFFSRPFAGDFEITQYGIAIAAFCFLPLTQLGRANVIVDIFTTRAGTTSKTAMDIAGSVAAILFAALLLWRMYLGMIDYLQYPEYTAILGIPLWTAFPPILFSLFLLLVAAALTAAETAGWISAASDSSDEVSAE